MLPWVACRGPLVGPMLSQSACSHVHMTVQVSGELLATVQRLYVENLQKLDLALTAICGEFDPVRYSKVRRSSGSPGCSI